MGEKAKGSLPVRGPAQRMNGANGGAAPDARSIQVGTNSLEQRAERVAVALARGDDQRTKTLTLLQEAMERLMPTNGRPPRGAMGFVGCLEDALAARQPLAEALEANCQEVEALLEAFPEPVKR